MLEALGYGWVAPPPPPPPPHPTTSAVGGGGGRSGANFKIREGGASDDRAGVNQRMLVCAPRLVRPMRGGGGGACLAACVNRNVYAPPPPPTPTLRLTTTPTTEIDYRKSTLARGSICNC